MAEICRRMAEIPDWMLAASWTPPNISASQCRVIAIPGTSSLPFLFRLIGTFGDIRDVFGSQFASVRHKGRCGDGMEGKLHKRWNGGTVQVRSLVVYIYCLVQEAWNSYGSLACFSRPNRGPEACWSDFCLSLRPRRDNT